MMLHPISWPNHGPLRELYLAEEAVGLVKSLRWDLTPGPNWESTRQLISDDEEVDEREADLLRYEEKHSQKHHMLKEFDEFGLILDKNNGPIFDKRAIE